MSSPSVRVNSNDRNPDRTDNPGVNVSVNREIDDRGSRRGSVTGDRSEEDRGNRLVDVTGNRQDGDRGSIRGGDHNNSRELERGNRREVERGGRRDSERSSRREVGRSSRRDDQRRHKRKRRRESSVSDDSSSSSSSSSSDSSRSSASSGSSSSSSSSGKKNCHFKIKKKNAGRVQKWVVSGCSDSKAKSAREMSKPGKSRLSLQVPALDQTIYRRLKVIKASAASIENIDPTEKLMRRFQFKLFDLGKPLMYLFSKAKGNSKTRKAIRCATRLWSIAVNESMKIRRQNVLSQLYPQYGALLSRSGVSRVLNDEEFLFGPKFVNWLVDEAKTEKSLSYIGEAGTRKPVRDQRDGRASGRKHAQSPDLRNVSNSSNQRYDETPPSASFAGRLQGFASAWSAITKDQWVLSTVAGGVELEFSSTPFQTCPPARSNLGPKQTEICDAEVLSLLQKGAISIAKEVVFLSPFFAIPKKSGAFRPIINLKALNQFIVHHHFKMEGIHMLGSTIRRGDWLAKLDLQDAYLTVPVVPPHRKFLQFRWRESVYEFTCLAFGLSSAPRIFTKLLRPVAAYLRQRGIRLIIYLDDILLMASSESEAAEAVAQTSSLLEALGFIVNSSKSVIVPVQEIEFLGFTVNSLSLSLAVPQSKLSSITELCLSNMARQSISIRDLMSIVGTLNWAVPAVSFARAHLIHLQRAIIRGMEDSDKDLKAKVSLSSPAKEELLWWASNIASRMGKSIIPLQPSLLISSDASLEGWGAVTAGSKTGGPWSPEERKAHINWLELKAAWFALRCFAANLRNTVVGIALDNATAVSYINRPGGLKSKSLCDLALAVVAWAEERNLVIQATFVPGRLNTLADLESRRPQNPGDWKLEEGVFRRIQESWPSQVDLFASAWNHQLPTFVSWFPQPEAWKMDAFSFSWREVKGYAFPPFNLIGRCIWKMKSDQASLVLVCPMWPSQVWFPSLLETLTDVPKLLPRSPRVLTSASGGEHPLLKSEGGLNLIACKLSGVLSDSEAFRTKCRTLSWQAQGQIRSPHINPLGTAGVLGVCKGIEIPFLAM